MQGRAVLRQAQHERKRASRIKDDTMRILLTNDDGYHAPGLKILEAIAAKFSDDVWIVAPADEQSGAGHSLTLTRPIRVRQHGEKRFAVAGTPTDAVMMALARIMREAKPDLILSARFPPRWRARWRGYVRSR
jgi:hypothetical protein